MAETFIGEIRAFSFGYAPSGWAQCNGQLLPINQNQALFSILGTSYGGNGVTTFALPDLRGRAPVHTGSGVVLGQSSGEEAHTLTINEMPQHTHTVSATSQTATTKQATGNVWATNTSVNPYGNLHDVQMSPNAISTSGSSQPHSNMQPYSVLNYCICINGYYPSRN